MERFRRRVLAGSPVRSCRRGPRCPSVGCSRRGLFALQPRGGAVPAAPSPRGQRGPWPGQPCNPSSPSVTWDPSPLPTSASQVRRTRVGEAGGGCSSVRAAVPERGSPRHRCPRSGDALGLSSRDFAAGTGQARGPWTGFCDLIPAARGGASSGNVRQPRHREGEERVRESHPVPAPKGSP